MRIIFMGSPEFSVPALEALCAAGHEIVCVYCQPPRPAGRGKSFRPTPVQARAEALGLMVRHPVSLKSHEEIGQFAALKADIAVVVAYGLILPQAILDAPALGCVNIHASLLPRWRGAAPIHRAIMAGDHESGICIMQMEAGLDTGPVVLRRSLTIDPDETTGALHDRLSALGAGMIVETLKDLPGLDAIPQSRSGVTYAAKIDKAEARIDWSRPAEELIRKINALSPFPGAWTPLSGQRLKFLAATGSGGNGAPGEALDDALSISCGQGALRILRAQRPGKGAQNTQDFIHGNPVPKGTILGE